MEKFDTRSLLKIGHKINPVIRLLAIPVAALFLAAFSHQLYSLIFEYKTIKSSLLKILSLMIASYALWPFLYVAIRGKSPKLW